MKLRPSLAVAAVLAVGVAMSLALLAMGREPWCRCGYVKLWHGAVQSAENSQHLTDWYTFTHLAHGFGFFWAFWLLRDRMAPAARFVAAVVVEAAWEVFENTPFVIERYRAETIALDYYGDSVVNALGDLVAAMAGFAFAAVVPVWTTVAAFVVLEAFLAYAIRDNLTLNVIMLLRPIETIKAWQAGE